MNNEELKLDLKAAENESGKDIVNVSGIAYSGNEMRQWGGIRTVIAVNGVEFSKQTPLMNNHYNALESKLGEVTPKKNGNTIAVNGFIIASSDDARKIIEDGKKSKWQLSIGATAKETYFVNADEKVKVNGMEFTGPIYVVTKSILREVSIVAIGADKDTTLTIAAAFNLSDVKPITNNIEGIEIMAVEPTKNNTPENPTVPALNEDAIKAAADLAAENAVKAERKRVSDIRSICAGEFPEIEAKAIDENWDTTKLNAELLSALRAKRPATGVNAIVKTDKIERATIEAALCLRAGIDEKTITASYGEKAIEAADKIRDISLKDICKESMRMDGHTVSRVGFDDSDIQAAFSSVSLPGILSNIANKAMMKEYQKVDPVAFKLCSVGSLNDFKPSNRFRLTDIGDLEPVSATGELADGTLTEEGAVNQLDTYGKSFCLSRKMIINDDLGAFVQVPEKMGRKAAKLIDKLFFTRLQSNPSYGDGSNLFSAAHNNYLTGQTFGKAAVSSAIQLFLNQKDAAGDPIAVEPRMLLVPNSLRLDAQELMHSAAMFYTGTTTAAKPVYNALSEQNIEVVSSPYLTGTAFYMFGNPGEVDTFELGFLRGNRNPVIQQGDTDFKTLGMWFRVFFDFGVREQDFRGMVYAGLA